MSKVLGPIKHRLSNPIPSIPYPEDVKCPYCGLEEKDDGNITNMPYVYGVYVALKDGTETMVAPLPNREGPDLQHFPKKYWNDRGDGFIFHAVNIHICTKCGNFIAFASL